MAAWRAVWLTCWRGVASRASCCGLSDWIVALERYVIMSVSLIALCGSGGWPVFPVWIWLTLWILALWRLAVGGLASLSECKRVCPIRLLIVKERGVGFAPDLGINLQYNLASLRLFLRSITMIFFLFVLQLFLGKKYILIWATHKADYSIVGFSRDFCQTQFL